MKSATRSSRRAWLWPLLASLVLASLAPGALASGKPFPFDRELRFDADPRKGSPDLRKDSLPISAKRRDRVRGSKRVPGLQFSGNGAVEIDLWCVSGNGQAVVVDQTITIIATAMRDNQCPPDRLKMDEDLLTLLTQVTSWRWQGELLVLVGPQPLRFRLLTN